MSKPKVVNVFLIVLAVWTVAAFLIALLGERIVYLLVAVPAAALMTIAARCERLSQSAQLVWPVVLLPGATFMFVGVLQTMGYGLVEGEPAVSHVALRATFFVTGLLLHFAAFCLLATESRASDYPGGRTSRHAPTP